MDYNTYITRHAGTITLVIDGHTMITKTYRSVSDRKKIMTAWSNAFKNIITDGRVYIHLSHDVLIRIPTKRHTEVTNP